MAPFSLDQWYNLNIGAILHVAYVDDNEVCRSFIGCYDDIIRCDKHHYVYFNREVERRGRVRLEEKKRIKMLNIYDVTVMCDNIKMLRILRSCRWKAQPLTILYTEPLDKSFTYPIRGFFKELQNGMLQLYHKSSLTHLGGYTCYYSLENIKGVEIVSD